VEMRIKIIRCVGKDQLVCIRNLKTKTKIGMIIAMIRSATKDLFVTKRKKKTD